jgi:hypothetical protein
LGSGRRCLLHRMEPLSRQCTMAAALPPVLLLASLVVSAAALSPELAVRSGAERGGIEVRDLLPRPACRRLAWHCDAHACTLH